MAARALRSRGPAVTLAPTALVHEAYLELVDQHSRGWQSRQHFFAIAARLMRRVLLRHEERRRALKRGGAAQVVTLIDLPAREGEPSVDLIALHAALERLEQQDPGKHRVVELRCFGGLSVEEIANLLGVSDRTVRRDWSFARAWLAKELGGQP